jgi:hypothetical protein
MGTCNGSLWRDELIPQLEVDYFNPVVADWTPECQDVELQKREEADFVIYVITPKMKGFYSIAEAVHDSCDQPWKTIFCFLIEDEGETFDKHQIKSLEATAALILRNGGFIAKDLAEIAFCVNAVAKAYVQNS